MTGDIGVGPSGNQVALLTGGYDHTIKLWQAHSGVCLRTMQHPDSQVNGLEILPNGIMFAAYGYQHIRMYDLGSGNPEPILNFEGVTKNITSLGFQKDGKWMYTTGEDCTARIWDLRIGRQFKNLRTFPLQVPVNTAALLPDQSGIMLGDQSGVIHLWDLRNEKCEQYFELLKIPEVEASVQDIAINPEGNLMAAVNNKGSCYIWALSGTPRLLPMKHIMAHEKYALKCKFSPDSTMLVTTSGDCTAKVWWTNDWSLRHTLSTNAQRWVWDCAYSADSRYLFTGSSDSYARLWDLDTGSLEREYCGHQKPITALAFKDQTFSSP